MGMKTVCSFVFIITALLLLNARQLLNVFLVKTAAFFFKDASMGNSSNLSSAENSFRADRPTTLTLVNSFSVCSFVAWHCSLQVLLINSEGRKPKEFVTSVSEASKLQKHYLTFLI